MWCVTFHCDAKTNKHKEHLIHYYALSKVLHHDVSKVRKVREQMRTNDGNIRTVTGVVFKIIAFNSSTRNCQVLGMPSNF